MISLQNITVSYGSFDLLKGVSFHISDSDKIGLVGRNGAGKSTLMKLIIGEQAPTSGEVSVPLGCKIGYLPQIMAHNRGRSVIDEVMSVYDSSHVSEEEKDENKKYLAEKTLMQLGFKIEEFTRATDTFSEGWNMRIELAKILLREPDVLLLDEPTNHLDIESIEWFEGYLKAFRGPVLLVSHDKKFLDNVTNRTVEIMLGSIHDYKVSYSKYVELRRERIAQQTAAWENQQKMIEKTEDFIRRFRYKPTKSNQVQSRIK